MRTLRYAIIGTGMMGREHIRNIRLLDDAEVAALADPDEAMRSAAAALAGPGVFACADWRELVGRDGVDAYVIAAPNHRHAAILRELIPLGRPILVEKPVCTTLADCRDVEECARAHGTPVWVAMEYRYMPPVARLLGEVRAGTAGIVRMVAIREHRYPFLGKVGDWNRFRENTGGTLVEKCCHFFDLMRLIATAEPVRLYASGGIDVNHLDEEYDGRRPDILDNAFVIVDFANGMRAMLDLCMFAEGAEWQETITVTGDGGRVEARVPGPARFSRDGRERTAEIAIASRAPGSERRVPVPVDPAILAAGDHHGATYYQHRRFADLVRHGGTPAVTLEDGTMAVAMGAAAERSVRTGEVQRL